VEILSFRYEKCLEPDDPAPSLASEWLSPEGTDARLRQSCRAIQK